MRYQLLLVLLLLFVCAGHLRAEVPELTVGIYDNPPQVFQDEDKTPRGIYVDLIQEIARQEGWQIQFVWGSWAQHLEALKQGQLDLITTIAYDVGRDKYIDYSQEPVVLVWGQIYQKNTLELNNILDLKGKKIAVMRNGLFGIRLSELCNKFQVDCEIMPVQGYRDAMHAVSEGHADAAAINSLFGYAFEHEFKVTRSAIIYEPFGLRFAAPEGAHSEILQTIDAYLKKWKADSDSFYFNTLATYTETGRWTPPAWLRWLLISAAGLLILSSIWTLFIRAKKIELARFKATLDRIQDCVFMFRPDDLQFIYVNNGAEIQVGFERHELLRMTPIDINPTLTLIKFQKILQPLIEKPGHPYVFETCHRHKNGQEVPVEMTVQFVSSKSGKPRFVAVVRDLTERKKAEESQRKNMHWLETFNHLQDQLIAPGVTKDKLSLITEKAVDTFKLDFCRIWVINPGDSCDDCIHLQGDDPKCQQQERCLHLITSEGRYTNIDGTHRRVPIGAFKIGLLAFQKETSFLTNSVVTEPRIHDPEWARKLGLVSFAGYRLQDRNGCSVGVFAMFSKHPLSEDEDAMLRSLGQSASQVIVAGQVDQELLLAKEKAEIANEAKSAFLAAMSHEIRTPLNAILGMGEIIKDTKLTESQAWCLNTLNRSGEVLLALINDILDLSKIEAGQLVLEETAFDLHQSMKETVEIFSFTALEKGLQLELHVDDKVPHWVQGDPTRLRQILLNLIGNAIKFTKEGGVTVHVAVSSNDHVSFSVSDTGPGILEDKQEEIFQPFTQADTSTTRKHGGTGLGLTICQRLASLMGGRLHLKSKLGDGSQFTFLAPLTRIASKSHPETVGDKKASELIEHVPHEPMNINILLVDDTPENLMVIQAFLENTPCRLDIAKNGAEAVEKFINGVFDLVLMDIQMPVMDGYEATRKIRAWERDLAVDPTPVIALTAHALQEEVKQIHDAGCDLHLTKPIRKKRLIETLREFSKNKRGMMPLSETHSASCSEDIPLQSSAMCGAINKTRFEEFSEDCDGDIAPFLNVFLEKLPIRIKDITDSAKQGDHDAMAKAAHTLKGSAAVVGADRLVEMTLQFERMGKSAQTPKGEESLIAIMSEAEAVQSELEQVIMGLKEDSN
ncbi:MAG: transporter substrate-binding domain-containing protein [Magnetococcales bacterium]|nr:transporter substrate-binding domain-containing protein [Magnetococcales bacterium]